MTPRYRWEPGDRCAWNDLLWRVVEVHPVAGVAFVASSVHGGAVFVAPLRELELVPFRHGLRLVSGGG